MSLGLIYYKRYRMDVCLVGRTFRAELPKGYLFLPWELGLLEAHAETKYLSFRHELDANVFPCLGDYAGCLKLMREITSKQGFVPQATWLVATPGQRGNTFEYCGTVQGLRHADGYGAIQNLGVVPGHRDIGLGTALLEKALAGFQAAGLRRAMLEVTAMNEGAARIYRRAGFRKAKTVYKVAEPALTG